MSKKILRTLAISLVVGLLLTAYGIFITHKESSKSCGDLGLTDVQRGYPLSYLSLKPSTSLCNSVESLSILKEGNAYHEEFYKNLLADIVLWSALTFCIIQAIKTIKFARIPAS